MSVKLTHLQILWGLAGARERFEEMIVQLIHSDRPDSQRVRIIRGDGGLDSFEGSFSDPAGIDVYQVKYLRESVDDARKKQIRHSFATVRDSEEFNVKSWTLCLPIDMSTDEKKCFEKWANEDTGVTENGEIRICMHRS